MHLASFFRACGPLSLALLAPLPLTAQTVITYADAETNSTAYVLGGEYQLTVATGTASQSGALSGTGPVTKLGAGTLTLTAANTYQGHTTIRQGTLAVDGGSLGGGSAGEVYVGYLSGENGTLNLVNGGDIASKSSYLGIDAGSQGTATISGAGSTWTNSVEFVAGYSGTGTLAISNGGTLSNVAGFLGHQAAGHGTATVTGAGSTWTNTGDLSLGNYGSGTLTIQDGGAVSTPNLRMAVSAGSTGTLNIGAHNLEAATTGGTLTATNVVFGAGDDTVNFNQTDTFTLGANLSGAGQLVQRGTGTTILTGNNTYSGSTTISGGALQLNADARLGSSSLSLDGGTLRYGAAFNDLRAFTLGSAGGTLDTNGFDVSYFHVLSGSGSLTKSGAGTLTLAAANTYTGGTVLAAGTLTLGSAGALGSTGELSFTGGTLQYTAANTTDYSARFSNAANRLYRVDTNGQTVTFSTSLTSDGASLTKSGAGTLTLAAANTYSGGTNIESGTLSLGHTQAVGATGTISVAAGATFDTAGYGFDLARLAGSGTATSTGVFSYNSAANHTLNIALSGSASLTKAGTGTLTLTGQSTLGADPDIAQGILAVEGAGRLTARNTYVGVDGGDNGSLHIRDGGQVSNGAGSLGFYSGSQGSALVTGSGSLWTNTGTLTLGREGSGSLSVADGGQVTNTGAIVGDFPGIQGAVTVTGAGSNWQNSADLTLGRNGSGSLTIADGGQVSNRAGYIGVFSGSQGAVTVTGAGSVWQNSSDFYLGDRGNGSLTIADGGQVTNTRANVGTNSGGQGAVTVTGAGSVWQNSAELYLGGQGTGSLSVADGGQVSNGAGYLGRYSGGQGAVTVTGAGSVWQNSSDLYLGGQGTGSLTIADGGQVTNFRAFVGDSLTSNGTAYVTGTGSLWHTTQSVYLGFGNASTGTATVTEGGTLRVRNSHLDLGVIFLAYGTDSSGTLNIGGGAAPGIVEAGNVLGGGGNASVNFNHTGSDYTFSPVLSGTVHLAHLGSGTTILTGNNTYTGGTTIESGTLELGHTQAVGSTGTVTVAAGATFDTAGYGFDLTRLIGSGTATGSGVFSYTSAANHTLDTVLSGSGSLTKSGGGTLTLAAANTYSGGTTVYAGTVSIGANSGLGSASSAVAFNGGTLHTSASFTASRPTTLNTDGGTFDTAAGTTLTWSGPISGGAGNALNKIGGGTLQLTSANTYAGPTSIESGTLELGHSLALQFSTLDLSSALGTLSFGQLTAATVGGLAGSHPLTLLNEDEVPAPVTLTVGGNNASTTFAGEILGTGTLVKTGAGMLTLASANTYTGGTTVSDGTLALGHSLALQSSMLNLSGGDVTFGHLTSATFAGLTGSRDLTLHNSEETPAPVTLTVGGNGASTTFAGDILGHGTLVKSGTGTLTLTGSITEAAFVVDAGTLRFDSTTNPSPQASDGDLTIAADATLEIVGAAYFGMLSGAGELVFDSGNESDVASLTLGRLSAQQPTTFSGNISKLTGLSRLEYSAPEGVFTLTGQIALDRFDINGAVAIADGSATVAQLGSLGTLSISQGAVVTATEGTLAGISSGGYHFLNLQESEWTVGGPGTRLEITDTLHLGSGDIYDHSARPAEGTGAHLIVETGAEVSAPRLVVGDYYESDIGNGIGVATLTLRGTSDSRGVLATGSIETSNNTARRTLVFDGGILRATADNADLIQDPTDSSRVHGGVFTGVTTIAAGGGFIDTNSYNVGITQIIGGTGALTKLGAGTLSLSGASTYTGGTALHDGALAVAANENLGDANGTVSFAGGLLRSTGTFTASRATTLSTGGGTFDTAADTTLTWNGDITGVANNDLTKIGAGALVLGGTNTYFGATHVNQGTLRLGSADALSPNTTLNVAAGASFDANGFAQTFTGLTGSGTIETGGAGVTVQTSASPTVFTGTLAGSGGVTVSGTGTLTIAGTGNTYTGETTVSSGTLKITGNISTSSLTAVTGTGILAGTGTVGVLSLLNGGTLAPGNSPGTLNAGDTVFESGGTYLWEINDALGTAGTHYDFLNITGTLDLSSLTSADPFIIELVSLLGDNSAGLLANFDASLDYSYSIASASGGISGFNASGFSIDASGFTNDLAGGVWSLASDGTRLDLNFTAASAVPEPSACALLAGFAVLALATVRRRRGRVQL